MSELNLNQSDLEQQKKAINRFLDIFISKASHFSFEQIFKDAETEPQSEQFSTPVKKSIVNYKLQDYSLIVSLCYNILNNLCCLNGSARFELNVFSGLHELVKNAYFSRSANESIKARLLYCLHVSKSKLLQINDQFINSIWIKQTESHLMDKKARTIKLNHFCPLIEKLLTNQTIIENSNFITKYLSQTEIATCYNFAETKVHFFETSIHTLRAFSGPNTIYISYNNLYNIFNDLNMKLDFEQELLYIKLEIIRIIQHELAHVVLRYVLNDINCSSPILLSDLKVKSSNELYPEAGVLCELKIFESRIDYSKSSQNQNVNYDYIKQFILEFLNNKTSRFDFKIAKIDISDRKSVVMALDMDDETNDPFFE